MHTVDLVGAIFGLALLASGCAVGIWQIATVLDIGDYGHGARSFCLFGAGFACLVLLVLCCVAIAELLIRNVRKP